MFLRCRVDGEPGTDEHAYAGGCTGMMKSMMYPNEPWPPLDNRGAEIPTEPTHEWYAPAGDERTQLLQKARDGDETARQTLGHVTKGGLLLRRIEVPA